jgi:hypothetical protein
VARDISPTDVSVDPGGDLERRVVAHYEALGFRTTRNVNLANHQIDLIARKHVPGGAMMTLMVEVKHRTKSVVGINEVTPFINTARHLIGELLITGAALVTNGEFSQDAAGSVSRYPAIALLHVADLERELFHDTESALKVCLDYESRPIFHEYIPLSGKYHSNERNISDVACYIKSWSASDTSLLLLIGDFGSGKTTILERVCYEVSKSRLKGEDTLVPIFLRLRTLRQYTDIWSFIYSSLAKTQYLNPPDHIFRSQLAAGRLLILLDGFDEVYTGASAKERGFFLARLAPLLSSPCPCVISTRPTYFDSFEEMLSSFAANLDKTPTLDRVNIDKAAIGDIMSRLELGTESKIRKSSLKNVIEVSQLSRSSIGEYISRFSDQLLLATNASTEEVETFLYHTYDLEDLMRRPLLLEMVLQTILAGKLDITKARAEIGPSTLYDMYTQMAVVRDIRKEPQNQFLKPPERLAVCRELAIEMTAKRSIVLQGDSILQAIIRAAIPTVVSSRHDKLETLERARTDIRVCGFLRFDDDGGVRFAHKSYSEFFIAQKIYIDVKNNPSALIEYSSMHLTKEVLYFLGSFARDQKQFGKSLVAAIRRTSISWPSLETNENLRDLVYRIAMASGALLTSLSIVGGGISNIEVRKVQIASAYFRDVHLVDMTMNNVVATKWEIIDGFWAQVEVRECRFEKCNLDLKCAGVDIFGTQFDVGKIGFRGHDWNVQDTEFSGTELAFSGTGRIVGGKFRKCPDIYLARNVKFEQGTEMSFYNSTIRSESLVPWYETGSRLRFSNCFLAGICLEASHVAALSKCEGVVFVTGSSGPGPLQGSPIDPGSTTLAVDGYWLQRGISVKQDRAVAADDLAQTRIDERRYRGLIRSLDNDKKYEDYVADIISNILSRGWLEKMQHSALGPMLV